MPDGFEYVQQGLRDLGTGFQEGKQAEYVAQDRQVANEQRQRMLDANNKMADTIGEKPNIWRVPVSTIQSYLRGGYDPSKLEQFMKKEFAPPSPFEVASAHMIEQAPNLIKQILGETDPQKKQNLMVEYAANLTAQGKFQYYDTNGKPMGIFNVLNDTAQDAVFSSAKDFVKQKMGIDIPPDSPAATLKSFVDKQPLFKQMAQEQASLPMDDQPIFAAMLRRINGMSTKELSEAHDKGYVKIQNGNDTIKAPLYPSMKTLIEYKAQGIGIDEKMVQAGTITPEVYNIIKAQQAANMSKTGGPVLDPYEVTGGKPKNSTISSRMDQVRQQTMDLIKPEAISAIRSGVSSVVSGVKKVKADAPGDRVLKYFGSEPKE